MKHSYGQQMIMSTFKPGVSFSGLEVRANQLLSQQRRDFLKCWGVEVEQDQVKDSVKIIIRTKPNAKNVLGNPRREGGLVCFHEPEMAEAVRRFLENENAAPIPPREDPRLSDKEIAENDMILGQFRRIGMFR